MSTPSDLPSLPIRLADARVLCIGDVMLDRYVTGHVDRISPEAPIPILRAATESAMLGGAGNVARNLAALGATAHLVAVVGDDAEGQQVQRLLHGERRIVPDVVVAAGRPTTVKTRFVAGTQQLLRADRETTAPVTATVERRLRDASLSALDHVDVVVVSDYAKGALSRDLLAALVEAARERGLPVVVDPKGPDYGRYRGASVVTPNRPELAEAAGMAVGDDASVVTASRRVIERDGIGAVLVTRSQDGLSLVTAEHEAHHRARAREVFDVSGAGDTVVGVLAAALAVGAGLDDAAELANVAGGIVVAKRGTATVSPDELVEVLTAREMMEGRAGAMSLDSALARIDLWRMQGRRIGFTNGCFDLLHPGHVAMLAQARAACDRLVVGLNDDASVARLKGAGRPVQDAAARAAVLASLATVDLVVLFPEDTPMRLIEAIRPDVLVKGADYARADVVGGDLVESYGGRVVLADVMPGHSTTRTVSRIAEKAGGR